LSTGSSVLSSIFVLTGSAIWTVIIQKSHSVENILVGPPNGRVPVGIVVSTGPGLYLAWASFACLVVSIVPYMIRYGTPHKIPLSLSQPIHFTLVAARFEDDSSYDTAGYLAPFAPFFFIRQVSIARQPKRRFMIFYTSE
jgi:hypothetical protein